MDIRSIIAEIDAEIGRLQQAKFLLGGEVTPKKGRGRPPKTLLATSDSAKPQRRTMSAAGKARIAAAQKARWAKIRKAKKS